MIFLARSTNLTGRDLCAASGKASYVVIKGEKLDPADFSYAIDDTDNPKYGKSTFRGGMWYGSKGTYHGQKIIVVVLVDIKKGFAIPLSYAFAPKKGDVDYKPGWEIGLDLFREILNKRNPT